MSPVRVYERQLIDITLACFLPSFSLPPLSLSKKKKKAIVLCGHGLYVIQMFAISKTFFLTSADAVMNITAGSLGILPTVGHWNKVPNNENI